MVTWVDKHRLFTFSPNVTGLNRTYQGLFQQDPRGNPFDNWMLCGVNGSCSNVEPLGLLLGGAVGRHNVTCLYNWTTGEDADASVIVNATNSCTKMHAAIMETKYFDPIPVCVYPHFVIVVSKSGFKNCTDSCYYAQCWNAQSYTFALVARVPRWIPVPVIAPGSMTLFRQKRDFGITAAIVIAIAAAAGGATTAAIAMSHTI